MIILLQIGDKIRFLTFEDEEGLSAQPDGEFMKITKYVPYKLIAFLSKKYIIGVFPDNQTAINAVLMGNLSQQSAKAEDDIA